MDYADIISLSRGLDVISEFYDVFAVTTVNPIGICAVALGKTIEDAISNGLKALELTLEEIDFTVIDEGKKGICQHNRLLHKRYSSVRSMAAHQRKG